MASRNTADCRFYGSMIGCRYGNQCRYSHSHPNSVPFCRFYNNCRYGQRCKFRHIDHDSVISVTSSHRILQRYRNGDRIMTDILTSGYLRQEIETIHKILIPSEIQQLCFDYWFIDICDEWDVESCTRSIIEGDFVKFEGPIAQRVKQHDSSQASSVSHHICLIYGVQSVSSGVFEWGLKLNRVGKAGIGIGVIHDGQLGKWRDGRFALEGHGAYWYSSGYMVDEHRAMFGPNFSQKEMEDFYIAMKIDLDESSMYYAFDGNEYQKASCVLSQDKAFRLVIIFGNDDNDEIELI